jgi:hypothetical protein
VFCADESGSVVLWDITKPEAKLILTMDSAKAYPSPITIDSSFSDFTRDVVHSISSERSFLNADDSIKPSPSVFYHALHMNATRRAIGELSSSLAATHLLSGQNNTAGSVDSVTNATQSSKFHISRHTTRAMIFCKTSLMTAGDGLLFLLTLYLFIKFYLCPSRYLCS